MEALEVAGVLKGEVQKGLNFAKDIIRGQNDWADRRIERYKLGILYPTEDRDELVLANLIPAYYSVSNIKRMISENVFPKNWSELTAVLQGFGKDVDLYLQRNNLENKTSRDLLQQKLLESEQGLASQFNKLYENNYRRKILQSYVYRK